MHGKITANRYPWRTPLAARLGAAVLALTSTLAPAATPVPDMPSAATAMGAATHPLRIITLAPSTTELVFAAGAGKQIVGTVLASDYPPIARAIPRVGDGIQLDTETILTLNPDIVVGWQASGAAQALATVLASLNIPLIYVDPQSLADIPHAVQQLGTRLGTAAIAKQTATALQSRIDALNPGTKALTVFLEISTEPLYTLGNDPLINDLLAHCGGVNVYAQSPIAAPQVSIESVLHRHPDALIVSPFGRETLGSRQKFWSSLRLPAAQAGHIYAIDPDWLHRPGPRMVDAAEALCADLAQARATHP